MTEEAKKQARAGVVVGMGALTGETKPRPRFDIDVMMQLQPETFSLFLIAMARMQKDTSLLGWFSISGIHGLPSSLWDNVGKAWTADRPWAGYCAHGVMAFPTWHRPYLALLEVCFPATAS